VMPSEFDPTCRAANDAYVRRLLGDVLPIVLGGRRQSLRWFRIESDYRDRDRSGVWMWDLDAFKGMSAKNVMGNVLHDLPPATEFNE